MQKWILKAFAQQIIGRLPKSYLWNRIFQKYITHGYYSNYKSFEGKLYCCQRHLDNYYKYSPAPNPDFAALQLGTGWWPIVPIGLYICGVNNIWAYDIAPLLKKDNLRRTLELYLEYWENGQLGMFLKSVKPERIASLEGLYNRIDDEPIADLLKSINIYLQTYDGRNIYLPDHSIDLFFSTVVLEHIGASGLEILFKEFKRIAADNAVMSHYIGLKDQYSSFDQSITPYNFLKFTDRKWRLFNNPLIPQSRLHINGYREINKNTGWKIIDEKNELGSLVDLNKINLAPEFKKYSADDLLVLFSWMVSVVTDIK
jgi:hypothetical protein